MKKIFTILSLASLVVLSSCELNLYPEDGYNEGNVKVDQEAGELDNLRASTRWIEDGSYLKVKNITLSYDIVHPALKKANINRIQPYVTLDNMITLTNYSGYDPEMSQYTSATSMGIDWGTYPCVKTVLFGVNVEF